MSYVVTLFKVMGDETRAKILYLLSKGSFCVHELAAALGTSVSNVSHHLRLLKATRLVRTKRVGQRVCYSLDDEHVAHLLAEALKHASHD
ncbi:MAG: winged helix-turn-helix transcriptional regulator [Firmicutes bacterium]|nr:winged helix-turn-helix transcriptional regulator [Candidatus Fermentithermobacillaceae bacterium]